MVPEVRQRTADWLPAAPAVLTVVVLYGGAIAGAVRTSLSPGLPGLGDGLGLDAWRQVLTDPVFADAFVFTLRITLVSTLLSAAAALGVAAVLRGRGVFLQGATTFPVLVPHLIVAVVAVLWLGAGGLVDRIVGTLPVALVRDRGGWGIVLVYVFKETPFLALLVLAAWDRRVREREEVATTTGAGAWRRMAWVVWPAVRTPLTVGSLIVAAFVLGSFEVPIVVGPTYPPTIATYALDATQTAALAGRAQAAAALLVAAVAAVVLAGLLVQVVVRRRG